VEIKALFIPFGYQRLCIVVDRRDISHRHVWRSTLANQGFVTTTGAMAFPVSNTCYN